MEAKICPFINKISFLPIYTIKISEIEIITVLVVPQMRKCDCALFPLLIFQHCRWHFVLPVIITSVKYTYLWT